MKKIIYILFITHCSLLITNAQWVQLSNGMYGGSISDIKIDGNNIFAANSYGIYFSSNYGNNWVPTTFNSRGVGTLVINGNYIIAGTNGYGIYFSSDYGATWAQSSLTSGAIFDIIKFAGNMFAAANTGTYISTNNGINWTLTSLTGYANSLTFRDNYIFAAKYGAPPNGVYASSDNGSTWTFLTNSIHSVLTLGANDSNIFAGTFAYGVYKSTNNGMNWNQTSLNNRNVSTFAFKGTDVYAGTYNNLNDGYGVYYSSNNGTNWYQTTLSFTAIGALYADNQSVFAGTYYFGIYITSNSGFNWIQLPFSNITVKAFAKHNVSLYAGTYNGLFVTSNLGINWATTSLPRSGVLSIAIDTSNIFNPRIYVGTNNGLFISNDGGNNWVSVSLSMIHSFLISPGFILAATEGTYPFFGAVYFSTDEGLNWNYTSLRYRQVYSLIKKESLCFAATDAGVYRSTNGGYNWLQTSLSSDSVFCFAISSDGSILFAGKHNGISYSADNGLNWNSLPFISTHVSSILIADSIFIAGTKLGIYVTKDFGANWVQKNEGLWDFYVNTMELKEGYIFAGISSNSVWKRTLNEMLIGIKIITTNVPQFFFLYQNYPNPFNPTTKIKFDIRPPLISPLAKEGTGVVLAIYDILGREVATLVNEQLKPGTYEVEWNAVSYPSGVYYYKLTSGGYMDTKKMILIK